jgi:hypothetical protein
MGDGKRFFYKKSKKLCLTLLAALIVFVCAFIFNLNAALWWGPRRTLTPPDP